MKQARIFFQCLLLLFVFSGYSISFPGQQAVDPKIPELLRQYQASLDPQKLFIHFDKEQYSAGETIWMKGYLVKASNHSPVMDSANVYLELWDLHGEKVNELIFEPRDGSFHGQILLDPGIPDGNYVIRAYSDWMLNEGKSFLLYKYFYVSNPTYANQIDNDTRRANREFNESFEKLKEVQAIDFFPEGGKLVEGLESRVVIRVTDGIGKGKSLRGQIRDQDDSVVAEFETNDSGLGLFSFVPEASKLYFASLPGARRGVLLVPLPPAMKNGSVLRTDILGEELEVNISGSQGFSNHSLLVQSKGELVFFKEELPDESKQMFRIPLNTFPSGISQVVLFSPEAIPIAERLVFINLDDQIYFDLNVRVLRTDAGTALSLDVLASDEEGNPLAGNYSVAVQYGDVGERTRYDNIFSNLLLGSDLKGMIEEPAKYFDYRQENTDDMVDLLLMTQSWQRFSWQEINDGGIPEIAFQPKYGVDVIGALVGQQDRLGVSNAEVRLRVVENQAQTYQTRTDSDGKFLFNSLPLLDETMVEIIPPMIAGRQLPEVLLDTSGRVEPGIGPMEYSINSRTLIQQITERGNEWNRSGAASGGASPERGGPLFGTPDQTIYIRANEPYSDMRDVIRDKAIGLNVSPSGFITIRGVRSIYNQNPPLFFVDGVESEGAFFSLHPKDVERVEIFRGASTAAFGARGASGALVAYTKRRDYQAELLASSIFLIHGIHVPGEFKEETENMALIDSNSPVRTAFWEPRLTCGEEGIATFEFRPVPGVTQYRIVIQGVGANGKIGYAEFILGN